MPNKTRKTTRTINIKTATHLKLSKMVVKVQAQGVSCFKQNLLEAMIDYHYKNPQSLKDIFQ